MPGSPESWGDGHLRLRLEILWGNRLGALNAERRNREGEKKLYGSASALGHLKEGIILMISHSFLLKTLCPKVRKWSSERLDGRFFLSHFGHLETSTHLWRLSWDTSTFIYRHPCASERYNSHRRLYDGTDYMQIDCLGLNSSLKTFEIWLFEQVI